MTIAGAKGPYFNDASAVAFAWRDKHNDDDAIKNTTRVALDKNRFGKDLDKSWYRYDRRTTRLHLCDAKGRVESVEHRASTGQLTLVPNDHDEFLEGPL